ncbi:MAG: ParB N-terminal domain-containing protein [Anaerolineae bacterium]
MDVSQLCLKIVPVDSVIVHEWCDPQRTQRLAVELKKDGALRNPPLVAEIHDHAKYVVLDGATRVRALEELGCRDVLVQIVDYDDPQVGLERWHHLVSGLEERAFLKEMRRIRGIEWERTKAYLAEMALAKREILCYVMFRNGEAYAARGGSDLESQTVLLNRIVDLYSGRTLVYRVAAQQTPPSWEEHDEEFRMAVVFPRYAPAEIMQLALNGLRLPMGVTRHIIPGRALGLNVALEMLKSEASLEEKNAWLHDLIKTKDRQEKIRFYQEPVFIFDE